MKVIWSRRAIRRLVPLREYIKKDSEQNATLVAKRILAAVELLQTQPEMGRSGRVLGTSVMIPCNTSLVRAPFSGLNVRTCSTSSSSIVFAPGEKFT